ncbi:hypothetical protein BpHYR1_034713 [Brachionus plicatilis]|uniref:Uncharacterized protein n=1 Tax=Brachionus plicatilis TaxID=10195 RepID=A0A3M7QCU6_BRAPC|nr:hypothetical protein BpHYR1_034713 [Brachionus plicatilis]
MAKKQAEGETLGPHPTDPHLTISPFFKFKTIPNYFSYCKSKWLIPPNENPFREGYSSFPTKTTVLPRSIFQSQDPKHNFGAGNKAKTFLTYTACVKVAILNFSKK